MHSIPSGQDGITLSVFTSNCNSPVGAGCVYVCVSDIKSSFGLPCYATHKSMKQYTPAVLEITTALQSTLLFFLFFLLPKLDILVV